MMPTLRRSGFSPFTDWESPLDLLTRHFDQLVPSRGEGTVAAYPVDIREDDACFYVDAELPGFTKEQIDVTLENGVLSVSAERKIEGEPKPEQGEIHLRERRFSRAQRAFKLPTAVDENKVEASLKDGVLHLILHKREEVRPRKIEVK